MQFGQFGHTESNKFSLPRARVTRLGDFLFPFDCFLWAVFLKNTEIAQNLNYSFPR
jgi:hypothetical protein